MAISFFPIPPRVQISRRTFTTLISCVLSPKPSPSSTPRSLFALSSLLQHPQFQPTMLFQTRTNSTESHSPLNDPSPNWTNRPTKETIILEGCDYEHWLVVLEFPASLRNRQMRRIGSFPISVLCLVASPPPSTSPSFSSQFPASGGSRRKGNCFHEIHFNNLL